MLEYIPINWMPALLHRDMALGSLGRDTTLVPHSIERTFFTGLVTGQRWKGEVEKLLDVQGFRTRIVQDPNKD